MTQGRSSSEGRPSHDREDYDGAKMERLYESLRRITELWKKLELTKPNTSEYEALMDKIHILTEEYWALIDARKNPERSK